MFIRTLSSLNHGLVAMDAIYSTPVLGYDLPYYEIYRPGSPGCALDHAENFVTLDFQA